MSVSAQDAIEQLVADPARYDTLDSLLELANQVSVNSPTPPGSPTVLYSGALSGTVHSNDLIEQMLDAGENIRVINTTPTAEFLESRAFLDALAKQYKGVTARDLQDPKYRGPAKDWLYDPIKGPLATGGSTEPG